MLFIYIYFVFFSTATSFSILGFWEEKTRREDGRGGRRLKEAAGRVFGEDRREEKRCRAASTDGILDLMDEGRDRAMPGPSLAVSASGSRSSLTLLLSDSLLRASSITLGEARTARVTFVFLLLYPLVSFFLAYRVPPRCFGYYLCCGFSYFLFWLLFFCYHYLFFDSGGSEPLAAPG